MEKQNKFYICPKCKSMKVNYIFRLKNLFGIIPLMQCQKCSFESNTFPIIKSTKLKQNKKCQKK
jgi:ribosomal protein L37AE/L43A